MLRVPNSLIIYLGLTGVRAGLGALSALNMPHGVASLCSSSSLISDNAAHWGFYGSKSLKIDKWLSKDTSESRFWGSSRCGGWLHRFSFLKALNLGFWTFYECLLLYDLGNELVDNLGHLIFWTSWVTADNLCAWLCEWFATSNLAPFDITSSFFSIFFYDECSCVWK